MAHPRWPGYDSKTGNPVYDNQSANMNRILWRRTKAAFKVRAAGRKRKKRLKRVEGANYIQLWNQIMLDITKEKNHGK